MKLFPFVKKKMDNISSSKITYNNKKKKLYDLTNPI